jgi:hypothetical protein
MSNRTDSDYVKDAEFNMVFGWLAAAAVSIAAAAGLA